MKSIIFIVSLFAFIVGCKPKSQKSDFDYESWQKVGIKYATTFAIWKKGKATMIELKEPYKNASSGFRYLILPEASCLDDFNIADFNNVFVGNLETFICTSTSHLANIEALNLIEGWVGFPQTSLVTSSVLREKIKEGKVKELSSEMSLNIESTIELKPNIIIGYTMSSNMATFEKLQSASIPYVLNADFLENHPLGRAEYIRFFGALFQKEALADSIFNEIERNYLAAMQKVEGLNRPLVISGNMYNGTWYAPGGESWVARFMHDAGAQYVWSEFQKTGSIEMDYETAFAGGYSANYWVGAASFESLEEVKNADTRYMNFQPFLKKKIYTYTLGKTPAGTFPYLEEGYLRADLVLLDMIAIFHPEAIPNHSFRYFRRLE
jgi:iron complex transport system substrate-binding protein